MTMALLTVKRLASIGRLGLLLGLWPANGALACEMTAQAEPASVVAVDVRGDLLLDDGRILKPASILWPGAEAPARRRALQTRLAVMLVGAPVAVDPVGVRDRWGRQAAQVFVLRGHQPPLWLQGQLLEDGVARAWLNSGEAGCRSAVRTFEMLAREGRLGTWSVLGQRLHARSLRQMRAAGYGATVVYEGVVQSVRRGRSMTFVNFVGPRATTPSWFVPQRLERNLTRSGHNLALLAGKRIRLQAEISYQPRPRLYVVNPDALDVLE